MSEETSLEPSHGSGDEAAGLHHALRGQTTIHALEQRLPTWKKPAMTLCEWREIPPARR